MASEFAGCGLCGSAWAHRLHATTRKQTWTNAEVVTLLRRLADDIDEPGADEWDGDGIVRVVHDRIVNETRWPLTRPVGCQACGRPHGVSVPCGYTRGA